MLIVFDLDGVITSESGYWRTARAGVAEIEPQATIPDDFIYWVKNHAVNHNWDLAFIALAAWRDFDAFRKTHGHLTGKHLLAACPGFREEPWIRCHEVCQRIQNASAPPVELLLREPKTLFDELAAGDHTFAVATGRPYPEAIAPLEASGILRYFDPARIVTHDDVIRAEQAQPGQSFGKPHPFILERAMSYDFEPANTVFVGDTLSDIEAAKAARVRSIGVLGALPAGPYREERHDTLAHAGCRTILNSVLELPQVL
jgi:phosphoglycolate phosphatase-like HAD superfamily hydrolase